MQTSDKNRRFEAAADAIVSDDLETLQRSLELDPELTGAHSPQEHRATLLHYAARTGRAEVLRLLIERGADVDACTKEGVTALHEAAVGDHLDCVRLLNKAGAQLDNI